jgi:hypothetical protein
MRRILVLGAMTLAACLSTPTPPPDIPIVDGGSDTETLTGRVAYSDGLPAVGVPVKLLPATYDPSHPDTSLIRKSVTDTNGEYRFKSVDTLRQWNVIAGDKTRNAWVLARNLRPGNAISLNLSTGKVFLVSLHAPAYATSDSGIAYFPGTDILTRCDSRSVSAVDSVPSEALRFVVESRAGWKHDTTLVAVADTARIHADRNQIVITP